MHPRASLPAVPLRPMLQGTWGTKLARSATPQSTSPTNVQPSERQRPCHGKPDRRRTPSPTVGGELPYLLRGWQGVAILRAPRRSQGKRNTLTPLLHRTGPPRPHLPVLSRCLRVRISSQLVCRPAYVGYGSRVRWRPRDAAEPSGASKLHGVPRQRNPAADRWD